jgi:hypothetical protein
VLGNFPKAEHRFEQFISVCEFGHLQHGERYVPVNPAMLIKEVFQVLSQKDSSGLDGISIPDM